MTPPHKPRTTRRPREERLGIVLDTAARLFYERGVHEVGMDELVNETHLGKATVYRLFASKDALVAAYLRRLAATIAELVDGRVGDDPRRALHAIVDDIEADIRRSTFRGCAFHNASAEFADADHPARRAARDYRVWLSGRLQDVATVMTGDSHRGRVLGRELAVIIDGCYTNAVHLGADGPTTDGLALAHRLIDAQAPAGKKSSARGR